MATKTISYAAVKRMRETDGLSINAIADRLGVHFNTVKKCYEIGTDVVTKSRKKAKRGTGRKKRGDLATVNRALGAAQGDAFRLQAKVNAMVRALRQAGVKGLTIDLEAGTASLTYHQVKTIRVNHGE